MAKSKENQLEGLKELTKSLNEAVKASRTAVSLARITETFPDTVTPAAMTKAVKDLKVMVAEAAANADLL